MTIRGAVLGRAGALLALALSLGGCDTQVTDRSIASLYGVDFPMTQDKDIVTVSYAATDRLMNGSADPIDRNRPILVTSIADINSLEQSSGFGLIVAEQIGSRLSQLGYTVVESKLRGTLAINGNGEFMLSRDARKLAAAHDAQAVVTGSYAAGQDSAVVSLKLIRLTDAKVLAAFDYSMPMGPNTRSLIEPVAMQ
jgi:TolB-like protein